MTNSKTPIDLTVEEAENDIWAFIDTLEPTTAALCRKLYLENFTLKEIAVNLHWMARRYADGRCTYAPGTVNNAVRQLQKMGVKLNLCGEGTPWARDGMGPRYAGLSQEEYEMGEPLNGWNGVVIPEEMKALSEQLQDLKKENERLRDAIECGALPVIVRYGLDDGLTIEQVRETAVFKMCAQALNTEGERINE